MLFCAEPDRVIEKRLELDLSVAQHVRIRRAAGGVLAQEFSEHAVLVFGREVDGFEWNANHIGRCSGVDQVLPRRAILVIVVVLPILHEEADDVVALLRQQPGGDRRIDTARHADDDALLAHSRLA